jgi:hypothetical protein
MDLIAKMLTVDPAKRYSVDDALKHPWLHTSVVALSARNLGATKDQLKKYLAKRRFRKAIMAQVAISRFKGGLGTQTKGLTPFSGVLATGGLAGAAAAAAAEDGELLDMEAMSAAVEETKAGVGVKEEPALDLRDMGVLEDEVGEFEEEH